MAIQTPHLNRAVILTLFSILITSVAGALTKHVVQTVSVQTILFIQYVICLLLSVPWVAARGVGSLKTQRPVLHLVRGLSGWACFYTYYAAIENIPLVDAALLRSAAPLCVPFVILVYLRHMVPGKRWIPIVTGYIGVAMILKPTADSISLWHLMGFGSAVTLAMSMVTTNRLSSTEPDGRIVFYYFLISAVFSAPFAVGELSGIPLESWPYLLGIGLCVTLAMRFYTAAFGMGKSSVLAPLSYFGVLFSGLLGWYIWDHMPDLLSFAGMALVILGGLFTILLGAGEKTATEE